MRDRCPSAEEVGVGVLHDHRLTFFGRSRGWDGGGVADVEACWGDSVQGVIYRMSPVDILALDTYENTYARVQSTVVMEGQELNAWVYRRLPRFCRRPPSPRYLATLAYGYGARGFELDRLLGAADPAAYFPDP